MSDHRPSPPPLARGPEDLAGLCRGARAGLMAALKDDDPLDVLTVPPFVPRRAMIFVLLADLAVIVLGVVAVVTFLISATAGLVVVALAVALWIAKWVVKLTRVLPSSRRLRSAEVLPAVVVQCYTGGFLPPDEDPGTPRFTGIVVFDVGAPFDGPRLIALGERVFAAKEGPDDGPTGDLKRMMLFGDDDFEHRALRVPDELGGSGTTYAAAILWDRDNDLVHGYLSTALQVVLVDPDAPQTICPVPRRFFESLGRGLLDPIVD